MSSVAILNGWSAPWTAAFAAANLGDIEQLAVPGDGRATGMFADFRQARRRFHLQQIARGASHWNDWATQMLALDRGLRGSRTAAIWAALAHVDLAGERFRDELDIETFVFPGNLSVTRAVFDSYLTAGGIRVLGTFHAAGVQVARDLTIERATFHGPVLAHDARCDGRVEARGTAYEGEVRWRNAAFARDCWFADSAFAALADFTGARFASDAGFGAARFAGPACFDGVEFADTLGMERCVFAADLTFRRARFAKRLFLRDATFEVEPVIDGAQFAAAPVLDGARFPSDAPPLEIAPSIRQVRAEG